MSSLEHPNIFKAFAATAAKYPNKIAVSYLGTIFTYSHLLGLVEHTAAALAALGFGKGDRIVMYVPNSVQFIVTWLAMHRIGAIAIPITPIYTLSDLKYIANDTGATAIVCSDRNFGYVKQLLGESSVRQVIVATMVDLLPWWKRTFGLIADKVPTGKVEKAPFVSFLSDMTTSSAPVPPGPDTNEEDIAEILFTGGTTKHPKGVPIAHGLFLVSSDATAWGPRPSLSQRQGCNTRRSPSFPHSGSDVLTFHHCDRWWDSHPSAQSELGRNI